MKLFCLFLLMAILVSCQCKNKEALSSSSSTENLLLSASRSRIHAGEQIGLSVEKPLGLALPDTAEIDRWKIIKLEVQSADPGENLLDHIVDHSCFVHLVCPNGVPRKPQVQQPPSIQTRALTYDFCLRFYKPGQYKIRAVYVPMDSARAAFLSDTIWAHLFDPNDISQRPSPLLGGSERSVRRLYNQLNQALGHPTKAASSRVKTDHELDSILDYDRLVKARDLRMLLSAKRDSLRSNWFWVRVLR